jgi:tRNA modification GTPase
MSASEPHTDTIAAVSTPPGRGGIGIVRLSGPQAAPIAALLVRLRQPLEHAHARLADVMDEDATETLASTAGATEMDSGASGASGDAPGAGLNLRGKPQRSSTNIDEALVTFFAAPRSYTSEDLVEIATHGSPVVLELLLRRALALGARLAEPGEFTQRAFLSGRLDLTQSEAVRDLIDAQTLTQARQAAGQMGGALSRRVAPVKQSLVELIALLEAGIDFAEDDVDVTPQQEIARRIEALMPPLAALEASFARGRLVHDGLTLAIVGRPNAGKSSLFNRLVERDRAIVTATPGTTRDLVTERIALDGIPLELVDTAGLREAREEVEQLGIARSREALADAALVLIVLDATQPLNDEERCLFLAVEGRPALVAVNKCDLLRGNQHSQNLLDGSGFNPYLAVVNARETGDASGGAAPAERHEVSGHDFTGVPTERNWLGGVVFSRAAGTGKKETGASAPAQKRIPAIPTSALTGEGILALRARILSLATGGAAAEPGMLTNLRQHQAVATTLAALKDAARANSTAIPHEMILLDLYRALWSLDSLTGQTTPDDILNLIFSTFCIGK